MARLTKKMRACLELVAQAPNGVVDVYDKRLDPFCDDEARIGESDTINRCFDAKLLEQRYDGDTDTGTIEVLPRGRRALDEASHGR